MTVKGQSWIAVVLGVLIGIVGFAAWSYQSCMRLFGVCIQYYHPFTEVGLLGMIFGGILVVAGILLAVSRMEAEGSPRVLVGKYCSKCGVLNSLEARFCSSCASEFLGRMEA